MDPRPHPGSARFGDRPGLDAVRGLAVAVIFAYHAAPDRLPLGILSIDVFFALSGFLITTLVLVELHRDGRLSLRRFAARRARRLLPALLTLLAVITVAAALGAFTNPHIHRDVFAALTYSSNFVQAGGDYFDTFAQRSPLEHLWTLAVEEQFYVVLPLVVVAAWALLRRAGRRRHDALRVALVALALAGSAAALWQGRHLLASGASTNRIYMGTDVRAPALLAGVAAAAVLFGHWDRPHILRRAVAVLGAVLAVGYLAALAAGANATVESLARGGWVLAALCAVAIVLAAASRGADPLGRIAPLRWLGTRSYGVYLYHLPLLVLLAGLGGIGVALAAAITVVAAEASHRWIESPARRGTAVPVARFAGVCAVGALAVAAAVVALPTVPRERSVAEAAAAAPPEAMPTVPVATGVPGDPASPAPAPTAPPRRVLVWGDAFAPVVAAALQADPALTGVEITTEAHPECAEPSSCTALAPAAAGHDAVVLALRRPEPFTERIEDEWDMEGPARVVNAMWLRFATAIGDVPAGLVTPPEERTDLGQALHLRHAVGADPDNWIAGAEPATWAPALAARLERSAGPAAVAPRRLLIVGDSVAWSLAAWFSPPGWVVWDRSQHGCNTAAGDQVSVRQGRSRQPAVCDFRADWAQATQAFHPDTVVIHTGTWETYDRYWQGRHLEAGSPEWTALQTAQFAAALDATGSTGARVMLVVEAAATETEPGKPFETTPAESARRMPAVLAAARAAAQGRANVEVLDATEALCRPECDPALRDDGVHYTRAGAEQVATWLTGKL